MNSFHAILSCTLCIICDKPQILDRRLHPIDRKRIQCRRVTLVRAYLMVHVRGNLISMHRVSPSLVIQRALGVHVRDAMIKTTSMIEMHRLRMTMTQPEQAMNSTCLTLKMQLKCRLSFSLAPTYLIFIGVNWSIINTNQQILKYGSLLHVYHRYACTSVTRHTMHVYMQGCVVVDTVFA